MKAIVAIDLNYSIGDGEGLVHHEPDDLRHFRKKTEGKTLIMGRKTYESLPKKLNKREIVVITRNKDYICKDKDVKIVHSKEEAISFCKGKEVFIAGGAEIYKLFEEETKEIHLSFILKCSEGSVLFPLSMQGYEVVFHKELNDYITYIKLNKK